ncbi:hypothetical protein GLOIN_2v851760 [Rhizophagus irregularis DAOM 181602=DAOM 197198]|uniref:Btb/poz domain-containing protein 19-like n=1 Tax=Rhizophagus irregularis (strain DAOM 181602 / DAOM 197198 / MUCL 43194) TaxID=747089 RepID=A0A2P4QGX3_RHIID|nr:hypothetical protein GLOIN_2v851760 [Rhizophagus irregularis DAOM 181602=DAOM 197198]POG76866.1 hypothetical protein GLOIN_2v851760 [Rhizophagus irregularis DAOM 181602=DAOM 197198]|eukprot:XP_025183732.1 hypothetical protein GLOIN_2v851760 [Rhizophagus irregularis DAOM 181602=DAOM 197198]
MSFEYLQEVSNDFENLLETDEEYDVIIYAGENEALKEIHAHSLVLRTRSQYFRTGFSKKWAEKKDGKFIFKKPNISPKIFNIILRFIYCGKINLANLQGSEILKFLMAADELNIQTLIPCIQEYLINHRHEFLRQQNSIEILETIYQHESFKDLWNFYLEKICEEPEILFKSEKFINLKAPLLELLLKRDDLNLDEIIMWDNLIKWCLAQHSNVSQDVKNWNKEDVTIMERAIHRFIPLIRFYDISPEDFLSKVFPYKGLLPDDLISNILTFHMVPNKLNINVQPSRKPKNIYDSTLIKSQHFAIFASWIEKKNNSHYNVRNIPYCFNLLYRASRDGNTPATFHNKCDNKGATIVVVKVKNTEQIVGGYNPLFWDSYYGPVFGSSDLYDDSSRNLGTWCGNSNNSYDIVHSMPIHNFEVDDYEVFQVVKR